MHDPPSPSSLPLPDLDLDLVLSSVMPIESYVTVYTGYVTDNATLSPNVFTESTYLFKRDANCFVRLVEASVNPLEEFNESTYIVYA